MIMTRPQIFMENDLVAVMCAINILYCVSGCISHSSFHAKTLPPSFIQPFLFFSLWFQGFPLVRFCCLCMQLRCNCWAHVQGFLV